MKEKGKEKGLLKNLLIWTSIATGLLLFLPKKAGSAERKLFNEYSGYIDVLGSYEKNLSNENYSGKFSLENEVYKKDSKGEDWKIGFFSTNYQQNNRQESKFDADLNFVFWNPWGTKDFLVSDKFTFLKGLYGNRDNNCFSFIFPINNFFFKTDFENGLGKLAGMNYNSSTRAYYIGAGKKNENSYFESGVGYKTNSERFDSLEFLSNAFLINFLYSFGPEKIQHNPNNKIELSCEYQMNQNNENVFKTNAEARLTPCLIFDEARIKYENITNQTNSAANENNIEAKAVWNNLIGNFTYSTSASGVKIRGGGGYRFNF